MSSWSWQNVPLTDQLFKCSSHPSVPPPHQMKLWRFVLSDLNCPACFYFKGCHGDGGGTEDEGHRPLEGLKLCLQKNQQLQAMLQQQLGRIEQKLAVNRHNQVRRASGNDVTCLVTPSECKIRKLKWSATFPILPEFDWPCVQSECTMLKFLQKLASGQLLFCTLLLDHLAWTIRPFCSNYMINISSTIQCVVCVKRADSNQREHKGTDNSNNPRQV